MPDESVLGGTAGVPIQGDLVGANFVQRVKLDVGADGVSTPVVGSLPVSDSRIPALGGAVAAGSLPVVLSSDGPFATATGSLTEGVPGTDTASSGLNGRLQRIAQRLTSLIALLPAALGAGGGLKVDGSGTALPVSGTITANAGTNLNTSALALDATLAAQSAKLPATLGQKAMAASMAVVLASDQSGLPITSAGNTTSTLANVAGAITSTTLLASNANRRGATLWNDSTSVCYVKFGSAASATSATVKLIADAYYEVPFSYTGIITGIWVTATGSMRTTEVTA